MGVFTRLTEEDIRSALVYFSAGKLIAYEGVAEGVENTNYRVTTAAGQFALTIFEGRTEIAELPFFLGFMEHLSRQGIPCPVPLSGCQGKVMTLAGKPAGMQTWLAGAWPRQPNAIQAKALGQLLGRMHQKAVDFGRSRENQEGPASFARMLEPIKHRLGEIDQHLPDIMAGEIANLDPDRWKTLPTGQIHADLFPGNVLFVGNKIAGVIDFYFACTEALSLDLAIALNAWGFRRGKFQPQLFAAILAGYAGQRKLSELECECLPWTLRVGALRFLLSRSADWLNPRAGTLATKKNPHEYMDILEFHRARSRLADYLDIKDG